MSSPNQTFLEKMFPRNSKQKSLRHWADSLRSLAAGDLAKVLGHFSVEK